MLLLFKNQCSVSDSVNTVLTIIYCVKWYHSMYELHASRSPPRPKIPVLIPEYSGIENKEPFDNTFMTYFHQWI